MKRWIAVPAVLVAVALAGCGSSKSSESKESSKSSSSASSGSSSSGSGGKGTKVSYISPVAAEPGQQQINVGLEDAAKEIGWTETVLNSALSSSKQVSNVETAISQGDNAIASWTLEPLAAAGAYEKAKSAGLPVIGMNSVGTGVNGTVWWQDERCEPKGPMAEDAAMINKIYPKAKTIMLGFDAAESTKEESVCFAKWAKTDGLDIINETNNESDTSAGSETVVQPLLTKYPEVQAIWSYNDETALGASAALLSAGKKIASNTGGGGVVVIGHNGDADAIEAIKQHRLSWTWDPNNVATGYASIKLMQEALKSGGAKAKLKAVIIKGELVDSSNVSKYVKPLERKYTLSTLPFITEEK
ncbi:MAG: sugar ABC transporter substrate-binding protein [Solirubrobacteraceae bacterium]